MGTKTIGITEDVYERLASVKRDDESFTDTIDRLLDTATAGWRHGFGRYSEADGETLERIVAQVRADHAEGFAGRQDEVLGQLGIRSDEGVDGSAAPSDESA
jgi:predicted CopG family antitoxin